MPITRETLEAIADTVHTLEAQERFEERVNRQLDQLERQLKIYVPGASVGYIGNLERWGDDRAWYVFLPHDAKIGGFATTHRHELVPLLHATVAGAKAAYIAAKGGDA